MLRRIVLVLALLCLVPLGCEEKKKTRRVDKYESKTWKGKQKEKAVANYRDLIERCEDSEWTQKARERLDALGVPAAPAGGDAEGGDGAEG